jgi:hypothetical protein
MQKLTAHESFVALDQAGEHRIGTTILRLVYVSADRRARNDRGAGSKRTDSHEVAARDSASTISAAFPFDGSGRHGISLLSPGGYLIGARPTKKSNNLRTEMNRGLLWEQHQPKLFS